MCISLDERVLSFIKLGEKIEKVLNAGSEESLSQAESELFNALKRASAANPWFTEENCRCALNNISCMIKESNLKKWLEAYKIPDNKSPITIAVIMAGNIPVVGFHDMLCVLISGNRFTGKMASSDDLLPKALAGVLVEIENRWEEFIKFEDSIIKDFDAVIATGSDNSSRYFDFYFGKYPNIIRKNRTSLAVLFGEESHDEIEALGDDIFWYFGLGCRNVTQIFVPENFNIKELFPAWAKWQAVVNHNKYANNYEYYKSIFLVNGENHFDTGYLLIKPDDKPVSPIGVLHYKFYNSQDDLNAHILKYKDVIQCVSTNVKMNIQGVSVVPLGKAQMPFLWDYPDRIDTLSTILSWVE